MSKVIGFLFPWRNTFRRLQLEKRWWHRLATVLFFVALTPTFLYSWVIADDTPANSFEPDIVYLGAPPGVTFDEYSTPIPQGASVRSPAPNQGQPPPGGTFDNAPVPQSNTTSPAPPADNSDMTFSSVPPKPSTPPNNGLDPNSFQPLPAQTQGGQTQRQPNNGLDFNSAQPINTIKKTIEMPDGKTVTYPGTTPDETINAEWQHKRNIATAKAAVFGFGWAVLVTLLFSYLLQAAYRALLYVIYGGKAGRPAPDRPAAAG